MKNYPVVFIAVILLFSASVSDASSFSRLKTAPADRKPALRTSSPAATAAQQAPQDAAPAQKRALTASEVEEINSLEKEWAMCLDKAGSFISKKKYAQAGGWLDKSTAAVNRIIDIARSVGATPREIEKMDRVMGMQKLSLAYVNLSYLLQRAEAGQHSGTAVAEYERISQETARLFSEAEKKFFDVPSIQKLCRDLLAALEDVNRKFKR